MTSPEHILPHLEPLKDVFRFNMESQILYHAPLSFEPRRGSADDGEGLPSIGGFASVEASEAETGDGVSTWWVGEEEMKIFVNSESWSLGQLLNQSVT